LTEYDGFRPILRKQRHIWITQEIRDIFDGTRPSDGFPLASDLIVGGFISGFVVNVSRERRPRERHEKIDLEQIVGEDEIWALCARRPPPGWRFFGRFLDQNTLVLLVPFNKSDEGENYGAACALVQDLWSKIYGARDPHRGTAIGDYISEPYYDTDDQKIGK
jgi:hypothetical protein